MITYPSRSCLLIPILSNVILRHATLAIPPRYLGKVGDFGGLRWIENIHG
jgi:integrase/recombinase XerD